jgi:Fe-S-cluster containining protein
MNKVIPISIEAIRQRESDPQVAVDAQRRADAVDERLRDYLPRMRKVVGEAIQEVRLSRKIRLMREIVGHLGKAMDGIAPCHDGCSQCCHIPVLISRAEAVTIADERGLEVATLERYALKGNDDYKGTPCPFLKENRCSIYDSRPIACRLHFNLDADNLLCQLMPGEKIEAPYLNNMQYHLMMMSVLGKAQMLQLADIRDFFPSGK